MLSESIEAAYEVLADKERILVFTGAGVSTESGIPDFRGPDGLWTKLDPEDFTIQRFYASKELRQQRWRMHAEGHLWGARSKAEPNRGHMAIADLHRAGRVVGVVTQNVDGLHLRSGIPEYALAELHGSVRTASCLDCGTGWPTETVLEWVDAGMDDPHCPECSGLVKTDVVMFGESMPGTEMEKAWTFLSMADAVLVVGSTVSVWPAADVVIQAAHRALPVVIVNQGPTDADRMAAVKIDAAAGEVLPQLAARLLSRPSIPS
ncbi:MAG TPA: Sir2 family NAD-dependent protein deacetylase [Acidimicrobiia bacterium]